MSGLSFILAGMLAAATPFLLAEIAGVTAGRSLAANIALVKHNAKIAAAIAVAFGNHGP